MKYTKEDYFSLKNELFSVAESGYKKFQSGIIPGDFDMIGVPMPQLRKIANTIKKADWRGFLGVAEDTSHEERMLQALIIAQAKCDDRERIGLLRAFVPKINNWAVCDLFLSDLKINDANRLLYRALAEELLPSTAEYGLRFAIILLMNGFIDAEHIDSVLSTLTKIRHEGYYVKMAVAWALADCCVNFSEKTLCTIENGGLDAFTRNKAISKICDSRRVGGEAKALARNLRIKT